MEQPTVDPRAVNPPPDEDVRLDAAMRQADRLLVASLRRQDRRRRTVRLAAAVTTTGVAMLIVVPIVWLVSQPSHKQLPLPVVPPPAVVRLDATTSPADKRRAEALSRDGWQLWRKQAFDDAADKFDQAVKLDPKLTAAWNGLGWAKFNGGHADDAVTAFEKVLALDPRHPAALNGLGQIRFARNQLPDAEKYLVKAAPKAPAAWWGLAKIYLLQGKWTEAQTYARKIVGSGGVTGSDLDDAKAMSKAADDHRLPDELRQKITPAPRG